MKKFEILGYGVLQGISVVYGIFLCRMAVDMAQPKVVRGYPMSDNYYRAILFRDYGSCLFVLVAVWMVVAFCYSLSRASRKKNAAVLLMSGRLLIFFFAIVATFIGFFAIISPVKAPVIAI